MTSWPYFEPKPSKEILMLAKKYQCHAFDILQTFIPFFELLGEICWETEISWIFPSGTVHRRLSDKFIKGKNKNRNCEGIWYWPITKLERNSPCSRPLEKTVILSVFPRKRIRVRVLLCRFAIDCPKVFRIRFIFVVYLVSQEKVYKFGWVQRYQFRLNQWLITLKTFLDS